MSHVIANYNLAVPGNLHDYEEDGGDCCRPRIRFSLSLNNGLEMARDLALEWRFPTPIGMSPKMVAPTQALESKWNDQATFPVKLFPPESTPCGGSWIALAS